MPKPASCEDRQISGWGRFPAVSARVCTCREPANAAWCLDSGGAWIPFGLGRSYGDSALASRVLRMALLSGVLSFDAKAGIINCQAGLSLGELLALIVPHGWFLPVVPGTRQVTVGGAIASDVHGKNHHRDGCFSCHVNHLSLMLPNGEIVRCSDSENAELFLATCGGMGLTGVILHAEIRLQRIESAFIRGRVLACHSLDDLMAGFAAWADWPYLVAWMDGPLADERRGRFLLMAGRHARSGGWTSSPRREWSVPSVCPGAVVNRPVIRTFNTAYYLINKGLQKGFTTTLEPFFFPLDRLSHWNRLYGKQGFLQYQLVLPAEGGRRGLRTIFQEMKRSSLTPALAVLKLLGPANANFLSFPRQGYTLALDYKRTPELFPFLERLDRIVLEHGGRLYLAKDARMPATMVDSGYPGRNEFARIRDKYLLRSTFQSLQSRRLGL